MTRKIQNSKKVRDKLVFRICGFRLAPLQAFYESHNAIVDEIIANHFLEKWILRERWIQLNENNLTLIN